MDWKSEHRRLWTALVPHRGQASTVQDELIRICGKLVDQAYRNGNLNWNDDHERMWRFVGKQLDDSTFSTAQRTEIRQAIEEIIRDHDIPDLSGDGSCYYIINQRAVEWCLTHPNPIPHPIDAKLNY